MITFVCWKWRPASDYRSKFEGWHVDALARMVRRHYHAPHRFVCVTDDPSGITCPWVEVYELWDDFSHIPNPSSPRNPSCYRRLKVFARNAGDWLGERIVSLDLDAVICGDITPLFRGREDFRIWGTVSANPVNGSLWMLRTGAHPEIWEDFDPDRSPRLAKRAGFYGSDQGWFAYKFGKDVPKWTKRDGVFSFRNDIRMGGSLPGSARIVFFHGKHDPWHKDMQVRHAWIREHYG